LRRRFPTSSGTWAAQRRCLKPRAELTADNPITPARHKARDGGLTGTAFRWPECPSGYARCSTDAQDLTGQHDALTTLGVKANRIYVDHGLLARRRRAAILDLTTVLPTTVTTVAIAATPPTRPLASHLAWSRRLPAPGSVGVRGSSPLAPPRHESSHGLHMSRVIGYRSPRPSAGAFLLVAPVVAVGVDVNRPGMSAVSGLTGMLQTGQSRRARLDHTVGAVAVRCSEHAPGARSL
jgi:hypothetical protein